MPRGAATGNIFISYRREDSAAYAGRVCDHLSSLFGANRVFMDVEDIAPGQQFSQAIDHTIAGCDAVLVIIGPRWLELLRMRSQEQQRDYVCHEIEAALARDITIVPVLVGGARMPDLTGLSDKLARLSRYQAAELRDNTFKEDCTRLAKSLPVEPMADGAPAGGKTGRKKPIMILGGAAILAGLLFAVSSIMGIGPWSEYRARKSTIDGLLATARTQADRTEYESAFRTYQNLLKIDPTNRAAMDLQVGMAMRWLQNFHVLVREGGKAEDLAGPPLAEIMSVLDAGLARTNGQEPRAADILAHMGWAHWLNQRLAHKEFGNAAERDLRQALRVDPSNVFAHAMLGSLLIQTGGGTDEAVRQFQMAVQQNKERPFVRRLQLGGMVYPRDRGVRLELIRVANDMRRNGEPIDDRSRRRILTSYNPSVNSGEELKETLSAVPPEDAWATYLWLDDKQAEGSDLAGQRIRHDFIRASILEIEGKGQEALAAFEGLRRELKTRGYDGRIASHVAGAITRLSR